MKRSHMMLFGLLLVPGLPSTAIAESDFTRHLGYHFLGNTLRPGLYSPYSYGFHGRPYYPGYYYPPGGNYGMYGAPDSEFDVSNVKASGRIVLEVQPGSAEVYINGHEVSQRDDRTFQEGVLVGAHTIEVGAPGYQTYYNEVDVQPGRAVRLKINLVRK